MSRHYTQERGWREGRYQGSRDYGSRQRPGRYEQDDTESRYRPEDRYQADSYSFDEGQYGGRDRDEVRNQSNYGGQQNYSGRQRGSEYGTGYGREGDLGSGYGRRYDPEDYGANQSYGGPSRSYDVDSSWNRGQNLSGHRNQGWQGSHRDSPRFGQGEYYGRPYGSEAQSYGRQSQFRQSRQSYSGYGPKGYRRSDERLQEEICETLTHHPGIDASEIEISVKNGEVTLSGSVDDRRAKRMIAEEVEEIWGVSDVTNQIRVKAQHDSDFPEHTSGKESGIGGKQNSATQQQSKSGNQQRTSPTAQ